MIGRTAIILMTLAGTALVLSASQDGAPSYIWNTSDSIPIGLYRLQPVERLGVTELVVIRPPEALGTFLDLNGFLPLGVPMLKRILALPGQIVCRNGLKITVDDIEMGQARPRDGQGRPLPAWQGCRVIADGEIFVMNWQSADSLDGRYFGSIPASAVIGQAIPMWTAEE
jgi:conjugative transfer signal peptidase TraF